MRAPSIAEQTTDRTRRDAARVPLPMPTSVFGSLTVWYSRRAYGDADRRTLADLGGVHRS